MCSLLVFCQKSIQKPILVQLPYRRLIADLPDNSPEFRNSLFNFFLRRISAQTKSQAAKRFLIAAVHCFEYM